MVLCENVNEIRTLSENLFLTEPKKTKRFVIEKQIQFNNIVIYLKKRVNNNISSRTSFIKMD